jgi:Rps23 Pro-64 3,4-dihydroxylase Tpa1-like proline 4-hydroxylase
MLNNNYKIDKITYPYTVWTIDNFLSEEIIKKMSDNWYGPEDDAWHKGHATINGKKNILEQGMRGVSTLDKMPKEISEIAIQLHAQEFTDQIGKLVGIEDLISDKDMRWSGMRTMLPGSFQLIHSDARLSPESGLRKELTVLIYVQPLYNEERDTGHLEIWDDNMSECIHKIAPKYNSAVIFLNSDTSYHGVPDVNFERRAFTFSILKDAEATKRSKALFVARPEDSKEVREEGLKRSMIKDLKM